MNDDTPGRIVLIHGLWMTPRSWEGWAARYEERGHRVLAPAWPGLEHHVPAANRVLFQVGLANLTPGAPTRVDFGRNDRAPLLFAAFGEDHVVPAKASRHNAEKYRKSSAVTEFKEFPGRPHFPGAPCWEEVADYALDWAQRNRRRS